MLRSVGFGFKPSEVSAADGVVSGPVASLAVSVEPEAPSLADARALADRRALEARSFLAQPDPLNRNVGVVKPFRIVPSAPQAGQNRGPSSWMPWMTSVR